MDLFKKKEKTEDNPAEVSATEAAADAADVKEELTEDNKETSASPDEDWEAKFNELSGKYDELQRKYTERFSGGITEEEVTPGENLTNAAEAGIDIAHIDDLFSDSEGMMKQPDKEDHQATPNTTTNTKGNVNISTTPYKPTENKASTGGFTTSPGNIGTATKPKANPVAYNKSSTGAFSTSPGNIGTTNIESLFEDKKEVK